MNESAYAIMKMTYTTLNVTYTTVIQININSNQCMSATSNKNILKNKNLNKHQRNIHHMKIKLQTRILENK